METTSSTPTPPRGGGVVWGFSASSPRTASLTTSTSIQQAGNAAQTRAVPACVHIAPIITVSISARSVALCLQVTTPGDIHRCVRSCGAIATALGSHLPSALLGSITFHTPATATATAALTHAALRGDIRAHRPPAAPLAESSPAADAACTACDYGDADEEPRSGAVFGVEAGEERGDAYRVVRRACCEAEPLQLLVMVPALPRGCDVEVQVIAAVPAAGPPPPLRAASDSSNSSASPVEMTSHLAGARFHALFHASLRPRSPLCHSMLTPFRFPMHRSVYHSVQSRFWLWSVWLWSVFVHVVWDVWCGSGLSMMHGAYVVIFCWAPQK